MSYYFKPTAVWSLQDDRKDFNLYPEIMNDFYAVIIAGGKGTRLWPISRESDPKQIKPFGDEKSLLQKSFERSAEIVGEANVWVETAESYAQIIHSQLDKLPDFHLIAEPTQRNTAPAVGLITAILNKINPNSIMLNVWSDHHIKNFEIYKQKVFQAFELLQDYPDYLIDIVVKPTYPATGFGYLEVGEQINDEVYYAKRFVEKPDLATAEEYLKSGRYYWNPAIFLWRTTSLLDLYKKHQPEMYATLMEIAEAYGTDSYQEKLTSLYPTLEKISVDYAIFEKTDKILLLPADLGWKDVGSWQAIYEISQEETGESVVAEGGKALAIDSSNTLIYGSRPTKLIGVVGVDDLVIVDTDDALLVMKKSKDQDVKKLVDRIKEEGLQEYL